MTAHNYSLSVNKLLTGTNIEENHGLGLGLSIARAAIESHHGTLKIESVAGSGTMIRILLPKT